MVCVVRGFQFRAFLGIGALVVPASAGISNLGITQGFAGTCPDTDFRVTGADCIFNCAGGAEKEAVVLQPSSAGKVASEKTVCRFPKGVISPNISISSDGNVDLYLLCSVLGNPPGCNAGGKDRDELIDRNSGLISDQANAKGGLHAAGVHIQIEHEGVTYSYSGDVQDSKPGQAGGSSATTETASATGQLPYDEILHLKNNGDTENEVIVSYSYSGVATEFCPKSGVLGCLPCEQNICQIGEFPLCDGSESVTCAPCADHVCSESLSFFYAPVCSDGRSAKCERKVWVIPLLVILVLLCLCACIVGILHAQKPKKKKAKKKSRELQALNGGDAEVAMHGTHELHLPPLGSAPEPMQIEKRFLPDATHQATSQTLRLQGSGAPGLQQPQAGFAPLSYLPAVQQPAFQTAPLSYMPPMIQQEQPISYFQQPQQVFSQPSLTSSQQYMPMAATTTSSVLLPAQGSQPSVAYSPMTASSSSVPQAQPGLVMERPVQYYG